MTIADDRHADRAGSEPAGSELAGQSLAGPLVAPSLFAAGAHDFAAAIAHVEAGGAEWLHIDVMDGHFVPNLSFGPNIVAGIRPVTRLFLDVHLMIEHPERFTRSFIDAGADGLTVHPEAPGDLEAVLAACRARGVRFGLALKPETPLASVAKWLADCDILLIMGISPGFGGQPFLPGTLARIKEACRLRVERGARFKISVDGGINRETGTRCVRAGVDVLVAGSAVFGHENPAAAIAELKEVKRDE